MFNVDKVLKELTLAEKASLCSGKDFWHLKGIERLDIPSIMVTDGPHGLRKQGGGSDHIGLNESVPATCFPTAVGLASTWNESLIYEVGERLGDECITEDVSVLLGPGINIKRHPLCGRNFEYFSEDPVLSGKLASGLIKGIQSKNVGTSLKHFVANNQEGHRMVVDTFVDERSLREIYLKGFEIAVKEAQPWTVMCSYNKVNGTYLSENKYLLQDVLKDEWGHEGFVVTDWGACNKRVDGLIAGQELEMPSSGGLNDKKLVEAVKDGTLSMEVLNERVRRILTIIKNSIPNLENDFKCDLDEHNEFARKAAAESMVLLKNDGLLPLSKKSSVALIGEFATKPRYQGSGSSLIRPTKITTAYDSFSELLGDKLTYAKGYDSKTDVLDEEVLTEAVNAAKEAEVVVLMIGLTDLFESEGFDRTHLNLPNSHTELAKRVLEVNKNVVVCLSNGSPVIMPWKDNAKAILEQYLGGQASGAALRDVLFGDVNPSGKLAETFPNNLTEFPANDHFPGKPKQVEYREGLFVGYRYYDKADVEPMYPFGFGLSYTEFEYSDITVTDKSLTYKVKNIGSVEGQEISQIYVKHNNSVISKPEKELKAYNKVSLNPGEEKTIEIEIKEEFFTHYSVKDNAFITEGGEYSILVGASSRDIRLQSVIEVKSNAKVEKEDSVYMNINSSFKPTKTEFENLLGFEIEPYPTARPFHLNSTLEEISTTFVGNMMYKKINAQFGAMAGNADEATKNMMEAMVKEMPFRNIVAFSAGAITDNVADGLLLMMNRRPFKGIAKLLKK